ncbi:MAG: class I SAM-dependent methyltransferase [Patescibacteria group bacterium]|nr:class I SAM-dependent methyltransferase [Patescibacteria group bacterium]
MGLRETYNKIAEEWHAQHQQDDWWVKGTDKFVSFLDKDSSVLDVGCGGGTKSRYLADRGLRVTGIDFAENMIDIARREVPEAEFLAMDLRNVDKLEGKFDGIFMQAVLLHIQRGEAKEVLKNISGKLKNEGYFYVAVKEKKPDGAYEEVKTEEEYGYKYERYFSYFIQSEIESYMKEVGLEIVFSDIKSSGRSRWIQVIGRKSRD